MTQALFAQVEGIDDRAGGSVKRPPSAAPRPGSGRLVRVGKYAGDREAVVYVVAIAAANRAIALINRAVVRPSGQGDDLRIEDLGRVSEALLEALGLSAGEFTRADAPRRK
jgi:hypothetical protein